jgi:PAS domain S-box-containing protein
VVGPDRVAGPFCTLAASLFPIIQAPSVQHARNELAGTPPRAIIVVAEQVDGDALGAVQSLAAFGRAPLLLVAGEIQPDQLAVALRLGAIEVVDLASLSADLLYDVLGRADARLEHLRRWIGRATLFEALVERDADGLLALDTGLQIGYASAGVERLLGYPAEELIGRSLLEFIPPDQTDRVLGGIAAALARPGEHLLGDALVRHADGADRHLEGSLTNLLGDAPIHALIMSFRDGTRRQKRQQELAANEQRFRELAEQAPVMIWMEDAARNLVWENRTALDFSGRRWEDEKDRGWQQGVHPADLERVRREYSGEVSADRGFTLEFRLRRHDGAFRHIRQIAVPRYGPDGRLTGYLGVDVDLTDIKERQAQVEEAEARYRHLAEAVPVIVWIGDRDNELTYQNRTAEQFCGRTLEQMQDGGWGASIHPDDRERVQQTYRTTILNPVPYQQMYRFRRWDGAYRWFIEIGVPRYDMDGSFLGFTGVNVDVHELADASNRLEEAEARYRHFIELSSDGIWRMELAVPCPVSLSPDEQIAHWQEHSVLAECNLAMAKMYGFAGTEEMVGARLGDLLPTSIPANLEYLRTFINAGYRLINAESHEFDREGRPKWFLNSLVGVVEKGLLLRCWGTQQDITARRLLEEEARQARKMETAGRLAGGIAHDFNNLLTAILGTSEILLNDLAPATAQREDVEEIKRAATRAANLTRQLLAFSRRQVLQPRVIDVESLVRGVETMLHRLIGEHISLTVTSEPSLWRVRADPGQIEQVIVNLAVNARDAMPTGGAMTIATTNAHFPGAAVGQETIMPAGDYLLLTVIDTGTGMDDETLRHLFEPFFTTKATGKGTGLGLATVYGIVKQSGGFIYADSELTKGSRFRIYLPRVDESLDAPDQVPVAELARRASGLILLVEDEEAVRRLTRRVLEGVGYDVLEAANGLEALTLYNRSTTKIDLVITDVIMPGMSGQELSARLRELDPAQRILYVSGYTDDTILQHGHFLPNTSFLQKPFSPSALVARVQEIVGAKSGEG